MHRPNNQAIERYYFEQFRSYYPLLEGKVEFTDKPDVVVRGALTVGIEIANLYITSGADPCSEQVQRVRRLRVIERAQAQYRTAGGRSIELWVDFEPEVPINDIDAVAKLLASVAIATQHSSAGQVSRIHFKHVPELRFLYHNGKEYSDAKWRPVQSYSVPSLSLERLSEVVNEKTKKHGAYEPCDQYWLLLVVDFMDPAQDQDLQWPSGAVLNTSPFDRILLYKPQFGQVVVVPQ